MSQFEGDLSDINERITFLFECFTEEINGMNQENVSSIINTVHEAFNILMENVKFVVAQVKNEKPQTDLNLESSKTNGKKDCLLKLQAAISELTCVILDDCKRKMEEKL